MYRRYTQTGESGVSMAQIKRSRLKDLLILLLIAALAASLAIGIPARLEKNSLRGNVIRQISKECDDAIASTKAMSPNGRSDSAAQLARIRSNLYAIRAINNLNHTESGEYLISEDRLNTLILTVDNFLSELEGSGLNFSANISNLRLALEELQIIVGELK